MDQFVTDGEGASYTSIDTNQHGQPAVITWFQFWGELYVWEIEPLDGPWQGTGRWA